LQQPSSLFSFRMRNNWQGEPHMTFTGMLFIRALRANPSTLHRRRNEARVRIPL
jgi:hypothetical protein